MIALWLLAGIGVALAGVATRAYWVERREGLRRSGRRVVVAVALACGLVLVAMLAPTGVRSDTGTSTGTGSDSTETAPAPSPVVRPPEEPGPAADPEPRARIAAVKAEVARLEDELRAARAELARLVPAPAAPAPTPAPKPPVKGAQQATPPAPKGAPAWPLYAAIAMLVGCLGAMLLGDPSTLWLRRRSPIDSQGTAEIIDVAALARRAQASDWKGALDAAQKITIEGLDRLDAVDYLYLRATANVMSSAELGHQERGDRMSAAIADLTRLLELAPHHEEARYLLGYAQARAGQWAAALEAMRLARRSLDLPLQFDANESVCLLMLAEGRLAEADGEGATRLFDEVTRLGVLGGQIPVAMVTHRILTVRGHLKARRLDDAAAGVARVREVEGLDEATTRAIGLTCDVYEIAIALGADRHEQALAATGAFFEHWEPRQLPPVDDHAADEFLAPPIDVATLRLPADVFRSLHFLEAVVRVELAARAGRALTAAQVDVVSISLLRALQYVPRQRDALAALAALYLGYRQARSDRAIEWLEAAIDLGLRSSKARGLLQDARRAERDRRELLDVFRSASTRFLSDPSVGAQVRVAMIQELGRFEEFRPVLLDLQTTGALDIETTEVTLGGLRERAAFVANVATETAHRSDPAAAARLVELHRELTALTSSVDTTTTRIAALERAVMEQLGQLVLR